jgi:hypothetical protein
MQVIKFMRKIIIISLILMVSILTRCGNITGRSGVSAGVQSTDTGKAKLVFKEYEHTFGKVTEGEKISYVFTFENKGTGALVIESATATCGCTIPKYDRKPILPGGSGNIEVVFDTSGRSGIQAKTITVKSNASIPVVLLKIISEVIPNENK